LDSTSWAGTAVFVTVHAMSVGVSGTVNEPPKSPAWKSLTFVQTVVAVYEEVFVSPNASTTVTGSPEKTGLVIVVLLGAVEVVGPVMPPGVKMLRRLVSPGVELAQSLVNVIVDWLRVLVAVQVMMVPAPALFGIVKEPAVPACGGVRMPLSHPIVLA
jgi:hypothetical protein